METMRIPVVTFGQDEFPGFYSRNSGCQSPILLDTAKEIADMLKIKWMAGLTGSVLIANPVPSDNEVPAQEMEKHIEQALTAAEKEKISGKNVTPFLLNYIATHTKGESLETNISLVINNAKLAAEIAVAMQ